MAFLRLMLLLPLLLAFAQSAPAQTGPAQSAEAARAEPDKSLFASVSARQADGSPLLDLVLAGECSFSPRPMCRVILRDTAIHTDLFSGAATGTAEVELAPEKLLLRELDIAMEDAALHLADGREERVDLHITGSGEYAPATEILDLSSVHVRTNHGLALSGSLHSTQETLEAHLATNLHSPAKLARLLGPAVPDSVHEHLPTGPVVLDITATGDAESFSGDGMDLRTRLRLKRAVTLGQSGINIPPLDLTARIRTDEPDIPLSVDVALPGARLKADMDMDDQGLDKIFVTANAMDLELLAPLARELSGIPFTDWMVSGRLDLSSDLHFLGEGIRASTRVRVREGNYASPLSEYMGQGVEADLRLRTMLDFASGRRKVGATLAVPAGEMLFGPAYLNLTSHPVHLEVNGEQIAPKRFEDLMADLRWQGGGRIRAAGDLNAEGPVDQWQYDAELEATDVNLGRCWDTAADALGLANFSGEFGLEGEGAVDLHLESDGEVADATGLLYMAGGTLTSRDDSVEVRDASLNLPFRYRLKGPVINLSPQYVVPGDWGDLHASLVRGPYVQLRETDTRMALIPNRFFLPDPLTLSVLDGTVRLASIQVDRPLSRDFEVRLRAALQGLDLARSTRGSFPLEGTLGGNLGTIVFNRTRLTVPGALEGSFFGGSLTIDHIFGEDPLAAHRKLGLSVSVREMDLERISRAMDVGRVTGLMDLDLHDVVVAYGQPVSMLLRAETSGQGDFERTVSLKAVNSLSVVGTGSGLGNVGVGMFASFFEEFSYERIGFQCTLNNDIFRVRGLVHDGGVEYLIKKPWLTGINVVNSNPKNYISFSDMLERVKRVVGKKDDLGS